MEMSKEEGLAYRKDNTYYDMTGKQMLVGDLLKVFHFRSGPKGGKVHYMYHVVRMEQTLDFPVMAVSDHFTEKPHCRMYAICEKETRIYRTAKIIHEHDWQSDRKKINPLTPA